MCDTLVRVTEDGVQFAKNSDRDPNESQALRWYAGAQHAPGDLLRCTWSTISQVRRTHAVLLSQPWWMWGAEMGANEHGVVIGNEAVFTRRVGERGGPTQLLGMDLVRLGLERGATRHEAVEVMVSLLEEHGQGGSSSHEHPKFTYERSFVVADPEGATVLETAGRHWATEEVAGARSISNGLTIPAFAATYADPVRGRVAACAVRRDRTTRAAAAASSPLDLMAALRDHGDALAPDYRLANGALRAACAHPGGLLTSTQTTASWVADLRAGSPAGGRHWVTGTAAPCVSLFLPTTVTSVPEEPADVANRFDPASRWWRHEVLHRAAARDLAAVLPRIAADQARTEGRWLADPPPLEVALAEAERATAAWLDLVPDGPDRRPRWARSLARRCDAQAAMPVPAAAGVAS